MYQDLNILVQIWLPVYRFNESVSLMTTIQNVETWRRGHKQLLILQIMWMLLAFY